MRNIVFSAALALLAVVVACKPAPLSIDPAYQTEIQNWRADREQRLRAADGWLSLVGLDWLHEGENSVGADPEADVYLDAPGIEPFVATIVVDQGQATLVAEEDAEITVAGEVVVEPTPLRPDDAQGGPDVLEIGRLKAFLIQRGDKLGVRIKDAEAKTRLDFTGIENFPINPSLKIEARLDPYPEPLEVAVPTAVGTVDHSLSPGLLHFTIDGRDLTLQPWISTPEDRNLFIVFTDGTSGRLTYGAGRFLSAVLRDDNTAILDFNKATTPPCGFTPFATCPLAPPENALSVDVEAGEQLLGH